MSLSVKRQFSETFPDKADPDTTTTSTSSSTSSSSLNYHSLGKRIKKVGKAAKLNTTVATNSHILATLVRLLDDYKSPNDTMQELIGISDSLVYEDPDNIEIMRRLSDVFRHEQDESAVRVKILALFSDFAFETNIEGSLLIDEVLSLNKGEHSSKVLSMGLLALHRIGISYQIPPVYMSRVVMHAKQRLVHHSHNVQRHAILVIGAFCPLSDAKQETLDLISKYTDSQDSRVRAQAFRSILTLGKRGLDLPPKLFDRAVTALQDDYECVRREVLPLIHDLGTRHPDHKLSVPNSDMEMRLVDAAFGRICGAINDLSMQVRTQAAELLGGMTMVSDEFLQQTLDKKLMSNLRKKRSLHERNLNHFVSGEWSSGKKWADDAPKEYVKAQDVSLMESGACGALVHGLEDEFLEVRTATVDTLCRLSLDHPHFAVLSLDFLVDMFNDEIESVRLQAIHSLRNISQHIVLREDQLETMLGALEDFSPEIREGLHLMLGACQMSTQTCLRMVVHKILDVLAKYPQDKESVFGCLQRVGQKHPDLCMSLTTQLLQNHPFFDNAEQDVEDPSYVCVLILLFNAAQSLSTMRSLLPEMVLRHYSYLRAIKPNFVPQLDIGAARGEEAMQGSTGSRQFLETLLSNIDAVYLAPRACQALLEAAQENLDRLANIDSELSGTAHFTATFLGVQLLIQQLQSCIAPKQHKMPSKESLNLLARKCLKLQNLFSYLTADDLFLVKQILLRAAALHLVIVVKDRCQSALAPCQNLLQIAGDMSLFLQENTRLTADPFTKQMLSQLAAIVDPKPGRVFWEILPIVQSPFPVVTPKINVDIKMCTARIIEPSAVNSMDNQIKITAGLIAAVPMHVEIDNLQEHQTRDLRIRIKYPDQIVHMVIPNQRDLKRTLSETGVEMNNWRLRTTVLLSHGVWTEATQVELSMCLAVRSNAELELCKAVKVLFAPKAVKGKEPSFTKISFLNR